MQTKKNHKMMLTKKIILLVLSLIFGIYYTQVETITKKNIDNEIALSKKNSIDQNKTLALFLKINKDAKSIDYKEGIIASEKKLMMLYRSIGENEKSIEHSQELEKLAKELNDNESVSTAIIQRASILSSLGLFDENYKELQNAKYYVDKITDTNKKHYHMSLIYQGLAAGYYIPKKANQDTILSYFKKSLKEAKEITDNKDILQTEEKYDMISYLYMNMGMYYAMVYKPQRLDTAEEYLKNSLFTINNRKFTEIKADKIPILNCLGNFYSEQNKHIEAIEYARQVIKLEKEKKSPSERVAAYATLTNSYEGLKNKDSTIKYMSLYTDLSDSLSHINKLSSDKIIKKINSKQDKTHKDNELHIIIISCIIFFVLVVSGWLFWRRNQDKIHEKYKIALENLKSEAISKEIEPILVEPILIEPENKTPENVINIPEETTIYILNKLSKFEKSEKFLKKDMSLSSLSTSFNTNPRYLSEIIKQHKGKNFNNYLHELRIHYITNKLYETPVFREYKISYLAEASGFSSREVFAVIFKKETGVTPSYFISQLKKDAINEEVI
ncbi:AraC-like DNA-binding protein [Chryseobacterium ginsenosidimutans]|uniref:helix-turn-helix transcriptional regulator n=1 Tax=Chryseobacterium ginsenosidimutans TaxID=687846 RepID=UPI0027846BA2|nr:helix-turn-helix transcriptional regulator [Chryseobacterium ginsenosidimutans]MDQ0593900.1 AraC-like DNA-binding protein [Chryseobacterium ginsenosidimutans]